MLWQGGHLWRADLSAMSPVPRAQQQLDEMLRNDIGTSDGGIIVMANGADAQAALRNNEAASAKLGALVDRGELGGFETVTRVLPSIAAQQARLASLPDADTLRTRLAEATQGLPLPASRLAPFIADVEAARQLKPVQLDELREGPLRAVVSSLMYERPGGGWSTLIALHPGPKFEQAKLEAALAGVPEVQVVDVGRELASLYQRYLHEAFVQVLLGALAVVVLLGIYLRSGRRLLAVCQPLLFAVMLTLGGMAVMQAALGILHLVGLLLIVAVGSNYALFRAAGPRRGRAGRASRSPACRRAAGARRSRAPARSPRAPARPRSRRGTARRARRVRPARPPRRRACGRAAPPRRGAARPRRGRPGSARRRCRRGPA